MDSGISVGTGTMDSGISVGTGRQQGLPASAYSYPALPCPTPPLQDIEEWEGAFISSTSRLVLPIDELAAPDWDPPLARRWARGGVVAQLEQLVLAEIEAHSEPLA
jgi:hypothetical protein